METPEHPQPLEQDAADDQEPRDDADDLENDPSRAPNAPDELEDLRGG
jgi:hypothetical protein